MPRNSTLRSTIFLLIFAMSGDVFAQEHSLPPKSPSSTQSPSANTPFENKWSGEENLVEKLTQLVRRLQDQVPHKLGFCLIDLETGKPLVAYDPNGQFHPASNIKLLTTAVGLDVIGPRYRWETTIGTKGMDQRSVKHLMIRGGGDPSLMVGHLTEWILKLKGQGINEIRGNLIIDASFFKSSGLPPGFEEKEQDGAYRSAIDSINLNWNHAVVSVSDGGKLSPHVSIFPSSDYFKIENSAQFSKKIKRPLSVEQRETEQGQVFVIKGQLKRGQKHSFRRRVYRPLKFFVASLVEQIRQHKIKFSGSVEYRQINDIPHVLIRHESEPFSSILDDINSWSNNLSAETVVLTLAAVMGKPTTFEAGLDIISRFAKDRLLWGDFNLTNGSGLFGKTKVSPAQMTTLLKYMHDRRDTYPEYRVSLAIAGKDGTMKHRLKRLGSHQIFAKTGTLDGVSGLSGYIKSKQGKMFAFSILQNDFTVSAKRIRGTQDELVLAILRHL